MFKVKTLAVLFSAYPCEMKHIRRNLNLPPFWRYLVSMEMVQSIPTRARAAWACTLIWPLWASGLVQHRKSDRKSTINGLPVTLRMLRVKSDKSDWFWFQSIVFTKPFKNRMSLDQARGRDFLVLTKRSVASGDENGLKERRWDFWGNVEIHDPNFLTTKIQNPSPKTG